MEIFRTPAKHQFDMLDLTWQGLMREKDKNPLIEQGGVYILRSYLDDQQPSSVPRFLATDPFGILYIGMSKCLESRLFELIKYLKPSDIFADNAKHLAANKYSSNEKMQQRFPYSLLRVTYLPTITLEETGLIDKKYDEIYSDLYTPRAVEFHLLNEYLAEYGELPPLNAASGSLKF